MQPSKTFVSLVLVVASASAVPLLNKRIAQTTIDSVSSWENACNAAGGGTQCNPTAVTAAGTLLAAADPCAQQDSGDAMVDLAKTLNNNQAMITAAQIFIQQPRNSPNSLAVPYCQRAPKNQELNGFFQCQFQGVNEQQFSNGQAVGGAGTIPFALSAPVNPPGSCPANPTGPIDNGVQISTLVQSPGTPASSSSGSAAPPPPPSGSSSSNSTSDSSSNSTSASSSSSSSDSGSSNDAGDTSFPPPQQSQGSTDSSPSAAPTASASSSASTASGSSSGNFRLTNGQTAQQQNAQFAQLTPSSSCTEGTQSCVNGQFAQCVNGKFVLMPCGTGTQCAALPLVNSPGTSITCTTESDAEARIAATGATGGITGSGSSSGSGSDSGADSSAASSTPSSTNTSTGGSNNNAAAPAASPSPSSTAAASSSGNFKLANGQAAQSQNAQFAGLTADSTCTEGQNACVDGGFAQCVGGKFVVTQCAGGTQCAALPLVNSPGTSIACTTQSDAEARIAATGATGGITGSGGSS